MTAMITCKLNFSVETSVRWRHNFHTFCLLNIFFFIQGKMIHQFSHLFVYLTPFCLSVVTSMIWHHQFSHFFVYLTPWGVILCNIFPDKTMSLTSFIYLTLVIECGLWSDESHLLVNHHHGYCHRLLSTQMGSRQITEKSI